MNNGFLVNNVVDVQEMVKNINVYLPIFIDDEEETIEEAESYSNEFSSIANKTCSVFLNCQTSIDNDYINIAPDEGKQTEAILNDQFCEEFAFLYLFPAITFGYRAQRDVKVRTVKYFNESLLHNSINFAAESDYIFCCSKYFAECGFATTK